MKLRKFIQIIYISASLLLCENISAQIHSTNISGFAGFGQIKGNSPSQTSLAGSVSFGAGHDLLGIVSLKLSYFYARKINYFLPEDRTGRYYPFIHSITVKGYIEQYLKSSFYLQGGLGFAVLNDRTFSDVNEWDYGIAFSAVAGIDIRELSTSGFRIGIGLDFALTFTNTAASYFMFTMNTEYFF